MQIFFALVFVAFLAACGGSDAATDIGSPSAVGSAATSVASQSDATTPRSSDAVDAANAFMDSLSGGQRDTAMYAFDASVRSNWSNLPAGVPRFDRNGGAPR